MASFLKLDHAEAEILTGTSSRSAALDQLAGLGVKEIVLTHADGVTVRVDGRHLEASWTSRILTGRTGRGDTCMAAYLACRSLDLSPEASLPIAARVTSRKMEREGPFTEPLEALESTVTTPLLNKLSQRGT